MVWTLLPLSRGVSMPECFRLQGLRAFSGALRRAGDKASTIVAPAAVTVAIIAGLWLGFQLVKVDDMCSMGRESLNIGAFMIGSAGKNQAQEASREIWTHYRVKSTPLNTSMLRRR